MYDILHGVKVIEVGSFVFVPLASAVLADWGADVIKVEHPKTGDPYRGLVTAGMTNEVEGLNLSFQYANRGKRSIGIDLTQPRGRELLWDLVAHADVFMTNQRPGVRSRLGLTVEDIRRANPGIIYVRGSGYGQKGPLADTAALDGTAYWARGGVGGGLTHSVADWPLSQRPAFGDVMAAMTLAGGVAGALYRRATDGRPAVVDVGLLNIGMWQVQRDILSAPFDGPRAGGWGVPRNQRNPLTCTYRTQDDRFISIAIVNPDPYWVEFCETIGRPDLGSDERYSTMEARQANVEECVALLDEVFASKPFDHWRRAFESFSGAWAPVQLPAELHDDEQARINGYFTQIDTHHDQSIDVVSSPVTFDEYDEPRRMPGAPEVGQHTEQVLLELSYPWEDIADLKGAGVIN
jgi:crotonobetainyl-CoA:carnitine CoA-transferase CaiB-like acyl-CoA transferase